MPAVEGAGPAEVGTLLISLARQGLCLFVKTGMDDGSGFHFNAVMVRKELSTQILRAYLPALAVLVVGLGGAHLAWRWHVRTYQENDLAYFNQEVDRSFEELRARVTTYQRFLSSLSDQIGAWQSVSLVELAPLFDELNLKDDYPGMVELGFAALRTRLPGDLESTSLQTAVSRPTQRSEWEVEHVMIADTCSAIAPNQLGDIRDTNLVAAAERAVRSGRTAISGVRTLDVLHQGLPLSGITLMVPVFEPGAPFSADSMAATNREPRGVIFGSVASRVLMESLFGATRRSVDMEIFAANEPSTANWVNRRSTTKPQSLDTQFQPYLRRSFPWKVYDTTWRFNFFTTPYFERITSARPSVYFWVAGTLLAFLLAALHASQIRLRLAETAAAAELREALDALRTAKSERDRLSRDLHDGAIQFLFGIRLGLSRDAGEIEARCPELGERLNGNLKQMDEVIAELRRFVIGNEPPPTDSAQLDAILRRHCEQLQRATGRAVHFEANGQVDGRLAPHETIQLANMAREALSNSVRHSGASEILLSVEARPDRIILMVADNGAGFDPAHPRSGQGLSNLQTRATEIGARIDLESTPDQGTRVRIELPHSVPKEKAGS